MAQPHTIDRRTLITGRALTAERVIAPPGGEIASILVQARPERLDEVEAAILALLPHVLAAALVLHAIDAA